MPSSRGPDDPERYELELLPQVQADADQLDDELRKVVARIVVDLHRNPWLGEPMDDRPPALLEGCRKIRFDKPGWKRQPRFRFVYRNLPHDGSVGRLLVLAIGRRDRLIAYAKAASRYKAWRSRK